MEKEQWPSSWYHEQSNIHVSALERAFLEYLMNEMYYWRDKAEKCGCHQCTNKGRLSHDAYWEEDHRVKTKPGMDHEGQRLYEYSLGKIDYYLERKKEIARRNKKK